ncbi:MAG: hypothetical protein V5A55_02920 [Halovenus sp.]
MSDQVRVRGRLSPWLFLVGLLLFLASVVLFAFDLLTGRDVLRGIALNGIAAAILMAWAAHDTLADPESQVDSLAGAAGTALLLYGVYLLASGVVITITGVWHARLVVGLWYLALAAGATVVGYLVFPTEAIVTSRETDPVDAYERARDACAGAAADVADGRYERARDRYETVQAAAERVQAADGGAVTRESHDDGEGSADSTENEPIDHTARANELVDSLLDQAETATGSGKAHLDDDAYGDATEAFETARAAVTTAADVATGAGFDRDFERRTTQAEAWLSVTGELATADGGSRAGSVAVALDALDGAQNAATERQQDLLDRKRGTILARAESTRRDTAVERLRAAADQVRGESITGAPETADALEAAGRAADRLTADGADAEQLRERTAAWTEVTALLTGGEQALEADDHEGVIAVLEAALLVFGVCERAGAADTEPGPRRVTAWLRACERIMDAYGTATEAVEAAEKRRDEGSEDAALAAYAEARDALEDARSAALGAGIDTAAIDTERAAVAEELSALGGGE